MACRHYLGQSNYVLPSSFPVAALISTKICFKLGSSFNLKAFERQLLYEIWSYTGLFIICLGRYINRYSASNSSYFEVHLNIEIRQYSSCMPHYISVKSICSSQYLTLLYKASRCAQNICLVSLTSIWLITIMKVNICNSGSLLLSFLAMHCPKSIATCLFPCLACFLTFQILPAHFFKIFLSTVNKFIWHFQICQEAARSWKSPINLQPRVPCAGVHLKVISDDSVTW